jgi:hypothetical protein
MRRPTLLVVPLLVAGGVGTVATLKAHESDGAFVLQQQSLVPVPADLLERFVASAPDPKPDAGRLRGRSAVCAPRGTGELRNPWSCTVSYPRGGDVVYDVEIEPSGRVKGVDRTGQLIIYGCCIGTKPGQ